MARSLSNAKLLASSVSPGLSFSSFRRGYTAAAPHGSVPASFSVGPPRIGKVNDRAAMVKEEACAWAPDPITGYYRPANCAAEIDPAELREMLLNRRIKPL